MKTIFNKDLIDSEKKDLTLLYESINNPSVFQNIQYPSNLNNNSKLNYATFYTNEKKILAYCIIIESQLKKIPFIKTAKIIQGPIAIDKESEVEILNDICSFYKEKKFTSITIQLRHLVNNTSEFILNELYKNQKYNYTPVVENKTTILIDLNKSTEEIYFEFNSILKKNIKSAINKNVLIIKTAKKTEINTLADIYVKMCRYKKINLQPKSDIINLCDWIINQGHGFILIALIDNQIIGGGLFVYEGKKTTYLIGATDPDYKKIPSSHLVIFEAIKIAKQEGQKLFDLGGFAFFSKKEDQVYSINQFKLCFSSNYVFYAKKIKISYNNFYERVIDLVLKIKS